MARYRVALTGAAKRQLAALPHDVQRRLDVRILALGENPRPPGSRKLQGTEDLYRVRVGDYRIVYKVEGRVLLVLVVRIGHRRDIYERL